ncbi:MAG TPA: single-stranded DNA-binding protein [Streptosporangiaceae bacterium]|nr:single-stranded DNA-binding protein [Streptosporangiaceae bacterium]
MLYEAHVSLTGYVATQPVTKLVKDGVTNVSMRVGWTPRRQDRASGEWVDGNTSFATVICWRKLATNAAVCLRKGDAVAVQGRLSVREFQDREGRPRTAVEIEASSIGHDLNRGVASFARVRPQTGMTAAEFAAQNGTAQNGTAQNGTAQNGAGQVGGAGQGGGEGQGGAGGGGTGTGDGSLGSGEVAAGFGRNDDGGLGDGAPAPVEPDGSFFDETAISELGEPEEAAGAAAAA